MDIVITELAKILTPYVLYIAGAFALSEILGMIPSVKENSVFQLIKNFLSGLLDAIKKAMPTKIDPPKTDA